jgi:hypothetical protein
MTEWDKEVVLLKLKMCICVIKKAAERATASSILNSIN